ncbi:hypothetical protein GGF43_003751 [Coemansia sp. RSA 2618]|nr:hypothetical protein GGF43_003751 [Coemansia sp. RSA 2618]
MFANNAKRIFGEDQVVDAPGPTNSQSMDPAAAKRFKGDASPGSSQNVAPKISTNSDSSCTLQGASPAPSMMYAQEYSYEDIYRAEEIVQRDLVCDVNSVLDAAVPGEPASQMHAEHLSIEVCKNLEAHIASMQQAANDGLRAEPGNLGVAPAHTSPLFQWVSKSMCAEPTDSYYALADRQMYPGVSGFIEFVANSISEAARSSSLDIAPRPFVTLTKFGPEMDPYDFHHIDMALTLDTDKALDRTSGVLGLDNAAMLVMVRREPSDQHGAFVELVLNTQQMFNTQLNRRFAWGLTVCGTEVRACLFTNSTILVSTVMDVAYMCGREEFATLLVDWSMCHKQLMGYDPTMCIDPESKFVQMDVSDDESGVTLTFVCTNVIYSIAPTIGRRVRCFIGYEKPADASSDDAQNLPRVLIKDVWVSDTYRRFDIDHDEIEYMREIRDGLAYNKNLDGLYPLLEAGGNVEMLWGSHFPADDCTDEILKNIDPEICLSLPLWRHKRMVMGPVGEPLSCARSVDELIVIINDVMTVHTEIVNRCGMLHRDLSINNIMLKRHADGSVNGILIDFDNARRIQDIRFTESAGTPMFMSINNIEHSDTKRTALDDWESMVYIIWHLCSSSINNIGMVPAGRPLQGLWDYSMSETAELKKRWIKDEHRFRDEVLANMMDTPAYLPLKSLLHELQTTLFYNPRVSEVGRGCVRPREPVPRHKVMDLSEGKLDSSVCLKICDPFARRAEIADDIAKELLAVTQRFRAEAQDRINSAK